MYALIVAFALSLCLACGGGESAPLPDRTGTPTPTTVTADPTATSAPVVPTNTPSPPATPESTATPAPTPTSAGSPPAFGYGSLSAPVDGPTPTAVPIASPTPEPISAAAPPTPVAPDVLGLEPPGLIPAPAPVGLSGWINSEALGASDFAGKVTLLDFWTYTCVNCIRTLPYLMEWHNKYGDEGLRIVGVHTPEFDFERSRENVSDAVADLSIEYAVAQDNERAMWQTYRVQAWPTKYIVDGQGFVRYYHRGEGSYADTERVIRYLLEEMGRDLSHIQPNTEPDPVRLAGTRATDFEKLLTRELYAGTLRNIAYGGAYVLNEEYYESAGVAREYTDGGERKNHFLFLHGEWRSSEESLDHVRVSADFEDYVGFRFYANEANAVLNFEEGEPYRFRLTLDGESVPRDSAGADVQYDADGNSFVEVDSARMYRLVRQAEVSSHELLLMPEDDRFSVYAFTFGGYPE